MKNFTTLEKILPKPVHSLTRISQICILLLFTCVISVYAKAQSDSKNNGPVIYTNENLMESVLKKSTLDLSKPKLVFQHILNSLPEKVKVYPTEGYYYFYFYQDGVKYAGNIRLDVEERANGNLLFNYFKATNDWSYDEANSFRKFGKKDGIIIKETGRLTYDVTSGNRTVTFIINDLANVKPPSGMLKADEKYLGPVFDESGIRFFLVFNKNIKGFHYILDETDGVADELMSNKALKNIVIGRRTGFAFYNNAELKRKVLIGVHDRNSAVNNYFDGPFDQLPDSFLNGDDLKNAILEVAPGLKGKIDRYGNFDGDEQRYLISPYTYYSAAEDLKFVEDCVTGKQFKDTGECFLIPDQTPTGDENQKDDKEGKADAAEANNTK